MKKDALGIDVSKKTIDVFLHQLELHHEFNNDKKGYVSLIKWLKNNNLSPSDVLICMEHTGLYSLSIAMYFTKMDINFCMLPALEIKRSLGIARGKNLLNKELATKHQLRRTLSF